MTSSVSEPFLLSNYALPKRFSRPATAVANVYATYLHASTSTTEGYATVAAQGDGIHILDLSTLHPVTSHTLGPSTAFSCPPVTRINKARVCTTYSVLEAAQGIQPEDRGKTVRMWRDNVEGNSDAVSAQVTVKTQTLPHRIMRLAVPEELPENVILVGPNGETTVTDQELVIQHSHNFEGDSELMNSFFLDHSHTTFVPNRRSLKEGVVVINFVKTVESLRMRVIGVESKGIKVIADLTLPTKLKNVLDVSCSASGFVSALESSGEWHSFQLEPLEHKELTLSIPRAHISLRNLSFVASPSAEGAVPFDHEVSLLSAGSSHVLLAGVASSEIVLLLWDLQYSVLLASRTLPIPSSILRPKKQGIRLHLSGSSSVWQQVILTLSSTQTSVITNGTSGSHHATSDVSNDRSTVLVVPLAVPPSSTVLNALGRASASEKWLASAPVLASQTNAADYGLDATQTKLIRQMRTAMEQKRVEAADDTFFAWVASQEGGRSGRPSVKVPLGHQLVKRVLELVFWTTAKNSTTDIPYSPKVVRYLLQQRCVSASMVAGGLIATLRSRNDWETILLTLKTVMDIPESDVMALLHTLATVAIQRQSDENAMQVDAVADSSVPSLESVLSLCVTYTMSAPALRLAIRKHLPDAAELTVILRILTEWIDAWCLEDVYLLPERTKKDLHGALVPVFEGKQKGALPPLDKILVFLQTLLDSSFLTFLTYPPSHDILQDIFSHLEPELSFTDDVEQLRGPLEPFVRAQAKAVHEAAHGVQKPDLKVDWRRRRKEAHEQASIAVGVYQIEELLL